MANFDAIPSEILVMVFQSIDSARQLGQCRRVCKKWNDPAEFAMFSKPIFITTSNTMSLLTHLTKKPSRAKLIRNIHLNVHDITEPVTQLLQLALTPSIERIVAPEDHNTECLLTLIQDIARESQVGFPNLKSIPAPHNIFSDTYRETLLLFKDSLETVCIPLDEDEDHLAFDELTDFKQLSRLFISCYFEDLPHIESILNRAHHLKEIEFGYCEIYNEWPDPDWMKQHVEVNQQAIIVKLSNDLSHGTALMEYLIHKYPNMKHLEVGKYTIDNLNGGIDRVCRAISQIPSFTLKDRNNFDDLFPYLNILKGDKNEVQILYVGHSLQELYQYEDGRGDAPEYGDSYDYEGARVSNCSTFESRVHQNQQRITKAQINIFRTDHDPSAHNTQVSRLENIGSFATDLQVDMIQAFQDDDFAMEDSEYQRNFESEVFFTVLNCAHGLEKLEFRAHRICQTKTAALQPYQRRQLDRLEIVGANVDAETFPQLNDTFHTINNLILSNCYVVENHETGITSISLTSTKVGSLLINTEKNAQIGHSRFFNPDDLYGVGDEFPKLTSQYKNTQMSNKPTEEMHVMLSLQGNKAALFKILPNCLDILSLTMEEYTSRPKIIATYHISCQSLAHLELNVNDMHVKIDIPKYFESLTQ